MRDKGNKGSRTTTNYGTFKPTVSRNDEYFPQSVVDFSNGDRTSEADHPTQKPIDLIRYLVKTFSNENELVFDGYMGSGTTAIACAVENRTYVGSELSLEYFEIANKRIENETAQLKIF